MKAVPPKRRAKNPIPAAEVSLGVAHFDSSGIQSASRHNQKTYVQSFGRGLFVLESLNHHNGATVNKLAAITSIDRGIVYRLLETLRLLGYVDRDPLSGGYWVKASTTGLSGGWASEKWINASARARIEELGNVVSWPISLTVPGGNAMVLRYCTDQSTPFTFRKMPVGLRMSMLHTASGRTYLSSLETRKRLSLVQLIRKSSPFAEDLEFKSDAPLDAIMRKARKNRYSIQQIPNITSIAVPIRRDAVPLGALCLRYYTTAMSQKSALDRYLEKLWQTANDIGQDYER